LAGTLHASIAFLIARTCSSHSDQPRPAILAHQQVLLDRRGIGQAI
jgi:hypothetical protein